MERITLRDGIYLERVQKMQALARANGYDVIIIASD